MSQRKLQQEVDRCFKRVAEGIAAFESTFDKIQQATNQAQKEKLEDTLKREIKKLQRQRDMIKSWAAGVEIKDKKPLVEHRKAIETVRHSLIDRLFVLYIWCGFWRNLSYHLKGGAAEAMEWVACTQITLCPSLHYHIGYDLSLFFAADFHVRNG